MSSPIFILNGPNLNLLGRREPALYGADTLADIEAACAARADALGLAIDFRQTNGEGTFVDWIHEAGERAAGLVVNAGAYTHTSIAIHDALRAVALPTIEVHLSNLARRERFRQRSYVAAVADGTISGLGSLGYVLALEALAERLGREGSA